MKKSWIGAVILLSGLVLSTPALAGNRDHYRGQPVRVVRGYHGGHRVACAVPRPHTSLYFGFGAPVYAPAPVYYPPAYYYGPAYGYGPGYVAAPYGTVVYAPPRAYAQVWVPGHYGYRGGTRFWIAGAWSFGR